jgi:hypothetical protein
MHAKKNANHVKSSPNSDPNLPPIRSSTFVVDKPSLKNVPRIEENSSQKLTLAQVMAMKKNELKKQQQQHKNGIETIEILDSHSSGNGNSPRLYNNSKAIDTILKNAQASGTLNLSDHDLPEGKNSLFKKRQMFSNFLSNLSLKFLVPPKVYTLNEVDSKEYAKNTSLNFEANDAKWWNQVELKKLILAFNKITYIPRQIEQLSTLVVLDVTEINMYLTAFSKLISTFFKIKLHDNRIELIDESLGKLTLLETLNIS